MTGIAEDPTAPPAPPRGGAELTEVADTVAPRSTNCRPPCATSKQLGKRRAWWWRRPAAPAPSATPTAWFRRARSTGGGHDPGHRQPDQPARAQRHHRAARAGEAGRGSRGGQESRRWPPRPPGARNIATRPARWPAHRRRARGDAVDVVGHGKSTRCRRRSPARCACRASDARSPRAWTGRHRSRGSNVRVRVGRTRNGAEQILHAVADLNRQAAALQQEAQAFVAHVRAA